MVRNYLRGTAGDQIKTLLAAAKYNMKKSTCFRKSHIRTQLNACGLDQTT
jgi:hypothetical protein